MPRPLPIARALMVGAMVLAGAAACGTSESDGGTSGSGRELCESVELILLAPVRLEEQPEPESEAEALAVVAQLAEAVPAELEERWADLLAMVERSQDDPGSVDEAEQAAATETFSDSLGWARATCPDLPPAWACPGQQSFDTIGRVDPVDGFASAQEALEAGDGDPPPADATELDRSDTEVLFGWLDDDGMVVETQTYAAADGEWLYSGSSACIDEGD